MTITKNKAQKKIDSMWGWVFLMPTLLGLVIFYYYPFIQNIINSFSELGYFNEFIGFVGFNNYKELFRNQNLLNSIFFTIKYAMINTALSVIIALLFAMALNHNIKFIGFFRVVYYLPIVAMPIAIIAIWKWMFNYDFGFINSILLSMGFIQVPWLRESAPLFNALIIVGVWGRVGYNVIIILSGLQNIPALYYEAAKIDGAGPVARFFKITIPMISPTLFFVIVLTTISSLQVFESIFGLVKTNTSVAQGSASVIYMFYEYAFIYNSKGVASALSIVFLAIILAITAIQFAIQKRWVNYDMD